MLVLWMNLGSLMGQVGASASPNMVFNSVHVFVVTDLDCVVGRHAMD